MNADDAAWTGRLILKYANGPTALLAGFMSGTGGFQAQARPARNHVLPSCGQALAQLVGFWVLPRHVWQPYVGKNGSGLKAFFPEQHLPVAVAVRTTCRNTRRKAPPYSREPLLLRPSLPRASDNADLLHKRHVDAC